MGQNLIKHSVFTTQRIKVLIYVVLVSHIGLVLTYDSDTVVKKKWSKMNISIPRKVAREISEEEAENDYHLHTTVAYIPEAPEEWIPSPSDWRIELGNTPNWYSTPIAPAPSCEEITYAEDYDQTTPTPAWDQDESWLSASIDLCSTPPSIEDRYTGGDDMPSIEEVGFATEMTTTEVTQGAANRVKAFSIVVLIMSAGIVFH